MKKILHSFISIFLSHFTKLTKTPKILLKNDKKSEKVLTFTQSMYLTKILEKTKRREKTVKLY